MAEDQQERQTDLWSAHAAEGISSTSLSDRYESSDNKYRTSPGFLRPSVSHNDRLLSTKHELTGTLNTGKVGKTDGGAIRDGLKLL